MFKLRALAIGIILGSLFAWHAGSAQHIHSQPGFPASVQWAILLAIYWAFGMIVATLLWPTVERVGEVLLVSMFPNLHPKKRFAVVDDEHPQGGEVWQKDTRGQTTENNETATKQQETVKNSDS